MKNLDEYFTSSRHPSSSRVLDEKSASRVSARLQDDAQDLEVISRKDVTKSLLANLKNPTNPITHSDIRDRTEHYIALATGHQVAEERPNRKVYFNRHKSKLSEQRADGKSKSALCIFKDVRVYINGYLEATTDIEMKRLVVEGGGEIVAVASQCTHIITSCPLSALKTHRLLMQKRRTIHVVKPGWVLDSLAAGKRKSERPYAIIKGALPGFFHV